jgi:2'-hydroxyisoflavone reductase
MKILILGGSVFLGRALVAAALKNRHEITLFNRGKSNPGIFPDVEFIKGNRDGDLSVIREGNWDAVIDTCGYLPRVVHDSASILQENTATYVFISSLSVYDPIADQPVNENARLGTIENTATEEINGQTYGPLKALCESSVVAKFPRNHLLIRPGLIVGPYDPTDRFSYWPLRFLAGGRMIAPRDPDLRIQFIDVRDLAEWIVNLIERGTQGIFNATGPKLSYSLGQLLKSCASLYGNRSQIEWLPETFLIEKEVAQFTDLPLWISKDEAIGKLFYAADCTKARQCGLVTRDPKETISDLVDWFREESGQRKLRTGITLKRECEILEQWDKLNSNDLDHRR